MNHAGSVEQGTDRSIRENLEMMARLEEKHLQARTFSEWLGDAIGGFAGSMKFVALHAAIFTFWLLVNLGILPVLPVFDPKPFMTLTLAVSLEAIFLSAFVLMKQNRMSKRAEARAQLDLQINILAEKEMTMALQMLRLIGARVGVRDEQLEIESARLSQDTQVEVLANEIEESLPD
jgi:uncharacterized membrane protein